MMYLERTWGAKGFRPFSIATCLGALLLLVAPASALASKPRVTQAFAQKAAERVAPKLVSIGPVVGHWVDPNPSPLLPPTSVTVTETQATVINLSRCTRGLRLHKQFETFGCEVTYGKTTTSDPPNYFGTDGFHQTCQRLTVSTPARGKPDNSGFNPLDWEHNIQLAPGWSYTVPGTSYVNEPAPPHPRLGMAVRIGKHWHVGLEIFTINGVEAC